MFTIFWLVSVVVTFFINRHVIKCAMKEDRKFFDDGDGQAMFWVMVLSPFVPILNILVVFVVTIAYVFTKINDHGVLNFARKILFIKIKEEEK